MARHPMLARADAAIANATAEHATDSGTDAITIRLRTTMPDRPYAESSFVGQFAPGDAWAIAGRLAADLGGVIEHDGPIQVVWGGRVWLSMPQLAARAGLAESTVRTYRSRGDLPEPDVMVGTTPGWLESTADAWIATLPGQGARTDLRHVNAR